MIHPGYSAEFGRRLRQLRAERGLTQAAAAAGIGVKAGTLSGCEQGRFPRIAALVQLGEFYGLPLDELVTGRPASPVRRALFERRRALDALPPALSELLIDLVDLVVALHRKATDLAVAASAARRADAVGTEARP